MKHTTGLALAFLSFSVFATNAFAAPLEINQPWRNISDPIIMSTTFVRSFSNLPVEASVGDSHKYWSGDYWALQKGNINYRWFAPKPQGFNLKSPTKDQAAVMTLQELSYLAPSEKFDLLNGRYNYPLVKEVSAFTSPDREIWEGMCHGWAPALMHHNEPEPKVVINPDGIQIPFGSADIKALISYYYAYEYDAVTSRQMGSRCSGDFQWPWSTDRCKDDMNAGAFHIVLTNKIGLAGTSFVADIENGKEVWNHVPVSYKMTIVNDHLPPESDSARGTVKTIRIKTDVYFVFNSVKNTWETYGQNAKKKSYEYTLDINASGMIIGGNWISKMRPDFLWLVDKVPAFNSKFEKLTELLNDN